MENTLVMLNPTRRAFIKSSGLVLATGGTVGLVEGCNASQWIQIALNDLPVAIQVVTSILSIAAAAQNGKISATTLSEINEYGAKVKTGLQTAQDLINKYKASSDKTGLLGQIDAVLTACQSDLTSILGILNTTDTALQTTISATIGSLIATVIAIQALIPAPPTPSTARAKLSSNDGANAIKEAFNVIVRKTNPAAVIPIN